MWFSFAGGVLAHAHLGELGEALGEIPLGIGKVGGPSLAAGLAPVARVASRGSS